MPIEQRAHAAVITHALAQETLTNLRDVRTEQVGFRKGLVKLGRICGYELIDGELGSETVEIETPLARTTGERVSGLSDVVIVNVLRAATPFVEGLLKAFPAAKQGVVSAGRDETAGMDADGRFPVAIDYVKLPAISRDDLVVVADPMLATGSTMCRVLECVQEAQSDPARLFVLSAVSAPAGLRAVEDAAPHAERLTVAVDDHIDDRGFIVPGLGDAGDRAFGTN